MRNKILLLLVFMMFSLDSNIVLAQGKYSIKHMTPEVQTALDSRRERFEELRNFKSNGVLGENNHGYVEVLQSQGNAQEIVALENHDRQLIYKTIAQQNGLENAIATIESVFAQVQSDKAEAGDQIQTQEGSWISK